MDLEANLDSVLNPVFTVEKKDQILNLQIQAVTIYSKWNVVKHEVRYGSIIRLLLILIYIKHVSCQFAVQAYAVC
jgi:hypothetical protein